MKELVLREMLGHYIKLIEIYLLSRPLAVIFSSKEASLYNDKHASATDFLLKIKHVYQSIAQDVDNSNIPEVVAREIAEEIGAKNILLERIASISSVGPTLLWQTSESDSIVTTNNQRSQLFSALQTEVPVKLLDNESELSLTFTPQLKKCSDEYEEYDCLYLNVIKNLLDEESDKIMQIRTKHYKYKDDSTVTPHDAGSYDALLCLMQENIYIVNKKVDEALSYKDRYVGKLAERWKIVNINHIDSLVIFILKLRGLIALDFYISMNSVLTSSQKNMFYQHSGYSCVPETVSKVSHALQNIVLLAYEPHSAIDKQYLMTMTDYLDTQKQLQLFKPYIAGMFINELAACRLQLENEYKKMFPEQDLLAIANNYIKRRGNNFMLDNSKTRKNLDPDTPTTRYLAPPTPKL